MAGSVAGLFVVCNNDSTYKAYIDDLSVSPLPEARLTVPYLTDGFNKGAAGNTFILMDGTTSNIPCKTFNADSVITDAKNIGAIIKRLRDEAITSANLDWHVFMKRVEGKWCQPGTPVTMSCDEKNGCFFGSIADLKNVSSVSIEAISSSSVSIRTKWTGILNSFGESRCDISEINETLSRQCENDITTMGTREPLKRSSDQWKRCSTDQNTEFDVLFTKIKSTSPANVDIVEFLRLGQFGNDEENATGSLSECSGVSVKKIKLGNVDTRTRMAFDFTRVDEILFTPVANAIPAKKAFCEMTVSGPLFVTAISKNGGFVSLNSFGKETTAGTNFDFCISASNRSAVDKLAKSIISKCRR